MGKKIGGLRNVGDYMKRASLWFSLLLEYPRVRHIFSQHKADGFFDDVLPNTTLVVTENNDEARGPPLFRLGCRQF